MTPTRAEPLTCTSASAQRFGCINQLTVAALIFPNDAIYAQTLIDVDLRGSQRPSARQATLSHLIGSSQESTGSGRGARSHDAGDDMNTVGRGVSLPLRLLLLTYGEEASSYPIPVGGAATSGKMKTYLDQKNNHSATSHQRETERAFAD